MAQLPKRVRRYAFTLNNPEEEWTPEQCYDLSGVQFLAGQYEIAPGTGTHHFQGYVVFNNPISLGGAKLKLGLPAVHLEVCYATHDANVVYVTKEETRVPGGVCYTYGTPPASQGTRTDISGCKDILDGGGSLYDVATSDFASFCKYHRAFRLYESIRVHPRDSAPEVYYHWGPAGSGKTRAVWETVEDQSRVYPAPLSPTGTSQWFDGYRPDWHTVMLFDDYYHNFRLTFFLQLLDRYPMYLPVKGSYSQMANCAIHITSNIPLKDQYPNAPDQDAIRRRFTRVIHYESL